MAVHVTEDAKYIYVYNIHYKMFVRHMVKLYGPNILDEVELFGHIKTRWFKHRAILQFHKFFAPEVYYLFETLANKFKKRNYIKIAEQLINNTWLRCVNNEVPPIDYSKLSDLKWELKPYQKGFIENYFTSKTKLNLRGAILAFEQGLGKTFTALATAKVIDNKQVFIVCPKSVIDVWRKEINSVFKSTYKIAYVGEDPESTDYDYVLCNYERVDKASGYLLDRNVTMIIDESHNVRYMDTKRAGDLFDLRNAKHINDIMALSGTPVKALASELVPILGLLDPLFDKEAMRTFSKIYKKYRQLAYDILQYRLRIMMDRKLKVDVVDLPEKHIANLWVKIKNSDKYLTDTIVNDMRVYMEHVFNETVKNSKRYEKQFDDVIDYCAKYNVLTSKEARFMKKMIRNYDIKNIDNINRFNFIYNTCYSWLTTHNKEYRDILRQSKISITSAIMKALGEAMGQVYTKRKIQAINDMVSENIDVIIKLIEKAEKKTIIWSSFKKVISKTSELLNAKGIKHVVVTGDTQDSDEVLKQFRLYDDINVLIASQKKLSTGVTLIEANQAIFLDLPYRDADFQQAVDRIHRIGQDTDVYIWKVLLETRKPNIITHANDIMQWSAQMSSIVMGSKQSPIEPEED